MNAIYTLIYISISFLSFILSAHSSYDNEAVSYSNGTDCIVKKEQQKDMITLAVTKDDDTFFIQYEYKYRFGNFMYCSGNNSNILVSMAQNKNIVVIDCRILNDAPSGTRSGIVDMTIDLNGNIEQVQINGMVKKFYDWEQDAFIICNNLKKVE